MQGDAEELFRPNPNGSPFNCLLRQVRGCWGPILTWILTVPIHSPLMTSKGMPRTFQIGTSWVPIQSHLMTRKGMLRSYSNTDPYSVTSFDIQGTWGPILTRNHVGTHSLASYHMQVHKGMLRTYSNQIFVGPHSVASYDTQRCGRPILTQILRGSMNAHHKCKVMWYSVL
jgi:hypothetical protein